MAGADGPAGVILVGVRHYNIGCEAGAKGNGDLAGCRKVKGLSGIRVSDGECQNSAADNRCDSGKESECVRSHGTGAKSPNDPKLSDGGGWRAGCTAGGKAAAEAASVTAGAVRCSAWLGDVGSGFIA